MKTLAMAVAFAGLIGLFQNCSGDGFGAKDAQGVADAITSQNRSASASSSGTTLYYEYHYNAGGAADFIYRPSNNNTGLMSIGYNLDGRSFSVLSASSSGTVLLNECITGGGYRFISNSVGCEGYSVGARIGYAYQTQQDNTVRLIRLSNPTSGAHWEVRSDRMPAGYANLGFHIEGSLGWIPM